MIFSKIEWRIFFRVIFLLLTMAILSYLVFSREFIYLLILIPIVIYQVINLYQSQLSVHHEVIQFAESIHYRDFSRYFDGLRAPEEVRHLRKGFNSINTTFRAITKEKETQYQYLQKVLELVNTGILSYEEESGDVMWVNESLKKMLKLPYLKTVHAFAKRDSGLYNEILSLKPGQSRIATIRSEPNTFRVILSATAFHIEGKKYKLIAFQNVNEALEETESKAWQKLLSVLTHEIMNSVAPISSLAETLKKNISSPDILNDISRLEDIELGIDTIKRRSEGLLKFAEVYRNLNKITKPNIKKIYVRDMFENLHHLMQPTLDQKKIELEIILKDPNLGVLADITLIEQVLINLFVNAIDAIKGIEKPKIMLSAFISDNGKTIISVADNGLGISEEVLEKIFVPFFSTKKNGSGIGLTLCKQIVTMHHGTIQAKSRENEGSVFILQL